AEALGLSLTTHDSRNVSLVLVEFARLALAGRDPERAARLTGAAEGMRVRTALRPWPVLRQGAGDLRARRREALGPPRFQEAFDAGARLSQRDAITLAQELQAAEARGS